MWWLSTNIQQPHAPDTHTAKLVTAWKLSALKFLAIEYSLNATTEHLEVPTSMSGKIELSFFLFIPRACAAGVKWLVCPSVHLSMDMKIARSRDLGLRASEKCYQNVRNCKKLTCLCFWTLETAHKCYKSCFFIGQAFKPHLIINTFVLLRMLTFQCHVFKSWSLTLNTRIVSTISSMITWILEDNHSLCLKFVSNCRLKTN